MLTSAFVAARRAQLCRRFVSWALLAFGILFLTQIQPAQTMESVPGQKSTPTPSPTPPVVAAQPQPSPITEREQQMMELIKQLQERVTKLEAQATATAAGPPPLTDISRDPETGVPREAQPRPAADKEETEGRWGGYTPNLGYKIVDTEYGDMNISIYTYVRYLNQLGLDSTYTDAFGNIKNVQRRQDIQLQKLQIKFLGWILSPKLRYFLYAWTSNATQGQGAQVVLAGNLNYTFNKHLTVGGGIRSLPGTRSVEGNFPFWLNVDSRMIADEFMRPSYTSGFWASGNITDRLKYQVMLGNNMSTLGVPATRLDNGLNTFSSALIWFPTGDFEKGFSGQGWGDFEDHERFSTRVGLHFTRSDENKENQPGSETFENTQLRLSDGSVIFTPDLFGKGITVTDARYQMGTIDAAFKYKGYSLEGEYYLRKLGKFRGTNTAGLPSLIDHGFQLQATTMLVPKRTQAYVGHSRIFGKYGDPWDFRFGINWFPYKNKVLRWNTEALYLYKSPVGYSSVPYNVGSRGWVFHSSMELAF
jgi:hypothetical protein